MKDRKSKEQKDFIYKFIKYSDNEVVNKIKNFEKAKSKTISSNVKKIAYMSLFI